MRTKRQAERRTARRTRRWAVSVVAGLLVLAGWAAPARASADGLGGLQPPSPSLRLSSAFTLVPSRPDLYSRAVDMAERYQVRTGLVPSLSPASAASSASAERGFPRLTLSVPGLRPPTEPRPQSEAWARLDSNDRLAADQSAELAGIQLTGRPVPPEDPADSARAYDLVASVPLIPSKVDVSAHYRLVDVDRLAGEAAAVDRKAPQTVGIGGKIALGGTLLKAGYEVTRQNGRVAGTRTDAGVTLRLDPRTDLSAGLTLDRIPAGASVPSAATSGPYGTTSQSQVRTSFGLGYRLSGDAALRASYTLINFGTRPNPSQARHEASAELSLRF